MSYSLLSQNITFDASAEAHSPKRDNNDDDPISEVGDNEDEEWTNEGLSSADRSQIAGAGEETLRAIEEAVKKPQSSLPSRATEYSSNSDEGQQHKKPNRVIHRKGVQRPSRYANPGPVHVNPKPDPPPPEKVRTIHNTRVPSDENGRPLGERLYKNMKRLQRSKDEVKKSFDAKEKETVKRACTFTPELSALARTISRGEGETVALLTAQDHTRRERVFQELKSVVERERLRECSFNPAIARKSAELASGRRQSGEESCGDRLYEDGRDRQDRQRLRERSFNCWQRESAIGGSVLPSERILGTVDRLHQWEEERKQYLQLLSDQLTNTAVVSKADPEEVTNRLATTHPSVSELIDNACQQQSFRPHLNPTSELRAEQSRIARFQKLFHRYDTGNLGSITRAAVERISAMLPVAGDRDVVAALRSFEENAPISFAEFAECLEAHEKAFGPQPWGRKDDCTQAFVPAHSHRPLISAKSEELASKRNRRGAGSSTQTPVENSTGSGYAAMSVGANDDDDTVHAYLARKRTKSVESRAAAVTNERNQKKQQQQLAAVSHASTPKRSGSATTQRPHRRDPALLNMEAFERRFASHKAVTYISYPAEATDLVDIIDTVADPYLRAAAPATPLTKHSQRHAANTRTDDCVVSPPSSPSKSGHKQPVGVATPKRSSSASGPSQRMGVPPSILAALYPLPNEMHDAALRKRKPSREEGGKGAGRAAHHQLQGLGRELMERQLVARRR